MINYTENHTEREKWIIATYRDKETLLKIFNPDTQKEFCTAKNHERCIMGKAPQILEVIKVFGKETAQAWLSIQLFNLSEYLGAKEKLGRSQIEFLTEMLLDQYPYFKITDFMLAITMIKMGRFGKMFGAVDPATIAEAFDQYWNYRADLRYDVNKRIEREKREKEFNQN